MFGSVFPNIVNLEDCRQINNNLYELLFETNVFCQSNVDIICTSNTVLQKQDKYKRVLCIFDKNYDFGKLFMYPYERGYGSIILSMDRVTQESHFCFSNFDHD